jgi:hypothetical protein
MAQVSETTTSSLSLKPQEEQVKAAQERKELTQFWHESIQMNAAPFRAGFN